MARITDHDRPVPTIIERLDRLTDRVRQLERRRRPALERSPDGSWWRLTVDDAGNVGATKVDGP